ncbi:ABC transporter substrate-binding protein [Streptomyces sp. LX-29]|uniref:ABC transporter substrate-binding protein n=1 Tax=Streptomyces sp. LX-29 TaxID=2900152 RepID=UPI00240D2C0F|nr:ABC transporter substrate-binding protein [Streptomyces sp. LX-29]WFB07315.1 ABC transporter substrate-binding protein [Streptomyces sp. LX-29]
MPVRPTATPARTAAVVLAALLAAAGLTACGDGAGGDPNTVKVAYNRSTDNAVRHKDRYLAAVKEEFEKAHPGKKVKLIPIQAPDNDYAAKMQQMMRSSKTAPDVIYEDGFRIGSDIEAGYLRPLDEYLTTWRDWDRYAPAAREAARGEDGKTYGVPVGTDTRGLWFNKEIFARAGLPADWRPRDWAEVLDAARTVKRRVPGVIPLNVYTGKGPGEAAVMQGFEMLLYGTVDGRGEDPLYDREAKKWITGSRGFRDALGFVRTVYAEKLGPDVSDALDPNVNTSVFGDWLPDGELAIALDGSWLGQNWIRTGGRPWPRWSRVLGQAPMPTQAGQAPGRVSMSGGWTWAIPAESTKPALAWKFIETLQTRENAAEWNVTDAQIAVRRDVAEDPGYLRSMPGVDFFTDLVDVTRYRPALPVYPQVSAAIGEAMEAVTTGDASPREAARAYDEELASLTDAVVRRDR